MIGKIRKSLTAKMCLVTMLWMAVACLLTYGLSAWAVPVTYSAGRSEALSAAAEALLCHLPVVTVDVPGMAELLNGSGVICENDDEALYLALRDVLLD